MNFLTGDSKQAETVRFIIVGGGTAAVFTILTWAFVAAGFKPYISAAAAYLVAFCSAYTLQRCWTFRASHSHSRTLSRYLVTQVFCAGLAMVVAQVVASWFGAPPFVTAVLTTLVSSGTSYFLSSRWAFA